MGAFNSSQRPPIRIEDQPGWDKGEWIQIKGVVAAEDFKVIYVQHTSVGPDGKPFVTSDYDMVAAMQCMVDDWCLLGDNNVPVDLYDRATRRKRVEIIAKLPTEYMTPVMNAIGEIVTRNQVQQPEGFTNGASEPTQASLSVVK